MCLNVEKQQNLSYDGTVTFDVHLILYEFREKKFEMCLFFLKNIKRISQTQLWFCFCVSVSGIFHKGCGF